VFTGSGHRRVGDEEMADSIPSQLRGYGSFIRDEESTEGALPLFEPPRCLHNAKLIVFASIGPYRRNTPWRHALHPLVKIVKQKIFIRSEDDLFSLFFSNNILGMRVFLLLVGLIVTGTRASEVDYNVSQEQEGDEIDSWMIVAEETTSTTAEVPTLTVMIPNSDDVDDREIAESELDPRSDDRENTLEIKQMLRGHPNDQIDGILQSNVMKRAIVFAALAFLVHVLQSLSADV
jgi:hypothetical protein